MAKKRRPRVGVCGSAGLGKAIIAQRAAKKMGLEWRPSSCLTMKLLRDGGYDYSSGEQVEKFLATLPRQTALLKGTKKIHEADEGCIVDRTFVDLAAYSIVMLGEEKEKFVSRAYLECKKEALKYDILFFVPWGNKGIEDNCVRTLNPWFQMQVSGVILAILHDWKLPYHIFKSGTDAGKVKEMQKVLGVF